MRDTIFMVSTSDHIKIAAFQELQNALRVKQLNDELLEYLASSLRWLLHYSKRNNIPLPDRDKIEQIIDRTLEIAEKLPRSSRSMTR
jgi:hypothetical protein